MDICFRVLLLFACIVASLLYTGCAHNYEPAETIDFSDYQDGPLSALVEGSLTSPSQSAMTDPILSEASSIKGNSRRERLYRGMSYIWKRFGYDRAYNNKMFSRTAGELFKSNVLGGCSDYALAEATFFRALGIPSRLVITANVDWVDSYRNNPMSMTTGHTFVEVYLEDRWHLVNSTYRVLYSDYNPDSLFFPGNEIFCRRAEDFWSAGIQSINDLDRLLLDCIKDYKDGSYVKPSYTEDKI